MRDTLSCWRRLAVAGITTLCVLAIAVPASAQTGGSGPPGSTTTPTTAPPAAPVGPPGKATIRKDGTAVAPADAPPEIQTAIAAANAIHTLPYIWGGGHRSFSSTGYDCSGAVSYVLHAAGLLASPMTSGCTGLELGPSRQGPLDHGLRQRQPRLHGDRGQALRHLLRRRPLESGLGPALAQEEAQAGRLHGQVLPGLLGTPQSGASPERRSRDVQPARRRLATLARPGGVGLGYT